MTVTRPSPDRARSLRQVLTDAEKHLWKLLRDGRLDGWKFRRQYPIDVYVADFVCIKARLVIELDGGQHAIEASRDHRRTARLENLGWHVIRFWNADVLTNPDGVLEMILLALERPPSPQPSPASGRGGVTAQAS